MARLTHGPSPRVRIETGVTPGRYRVRAESVRPTVAVDMSLNDSLQGRAITFAPQLLALRMHHRQGGPKHREPRTENPAEVESHISKHEAEGWHNQWQSGRRNAAIRSRIYLWSLAVNGGISAKLEAWHSSDGPSTRAANADLRRLKWCRYGSGARLFGEGWPG
ncbi:hypothetical protein IF2G_03843 [Cordyceps javanica]|nr:hypothetical protein IF2G_03843 [Cordyceps javanica]